MIVTQEFIFSQFSPIHIPTPYFLESHLSTMLPAGYLIKAFKTFIVLDIVVQTGCGAHPASCTMGTGGSFPGGKAAGP
jgi:hypothetical protein